jgi:hypothetical protein
MGFRSVSLSFHFERDAQIGRPPQYGRASRGFMPLSDNQDGTSDELLGLGESLCNLKKTQVARKHDGPPALEEAGAHLDERSSRESLLSDLRSIVSAAHKLRAEVTPPARVWRSLRLQLEKEGVFNRWEKERLQGARDFQNSGKLEKNLRILAQHQSRR